MKIVHLVAANVNLGPLVFGLGCYVLKQFNKWIPGCRAFVEQ